MSASWCTPTRRVSTRRTCTALGGPRAPVPLARSSPWNCPNSVATFAVCSGRRRSGRHSRGPAPTRRSSPNSRRASVNSSRRPKQRSGRACSRNNRSPRASLEANPVAIAGRGPVVRAEQRVETEASVQAARAVPGTGARSHLGRRRLPGPRRTSPAASVRGGGPGCAPGHLHRVYVRVPRLSRLEPCRDRPARPGKAHAGCAGPVPAPAVLVRQRIFLRNLRRLRGGGGVHRVRRLPRDV